MFFSKGPYLCGNEEESNENIFYFLTKHNF